MEHGLGIGIAILDALYLAAVGACGIAYYLRGFSIRRPREG